MFQSNQDVQFLSITGGDNSFFADKGWLFGILLASAVALVIIGGIKSIANAYSRIVPSMAGLYLLSALTILMLSIDKIDDALNLIIQSAFGLGALQAVQLEH